MNVRFFALLLLPICPHLSAQIKSPNLRCTIPALHPGDFDDEIQPGSTQESKAFAQSPHGVQRPDKHSLDVHWAGGVHHFRDARPFEPLAGVRWLYCEYDRQIGMHLIGKDDWGTFTGVLLNDKTGAVLPAGEEVSYSPNRRYYLASEQPDGQDGPTLKVYRSDGHLIWKGYGGILESNGVNVAADLVNVGWNDQNRVVMEIALPSGKHQLETLTPVSSHWRWLPKLAP